MKRNYEQPIIKLIVCDAEDCLAASPGLNNSIIDMNPNWASWEEYLI